MLPFIEVFTFKCFWFVFAILDPLFFNAGGSVRLYSCEKAEFRLEQLGLGRWRQLVEWEGRPGSELCRRGRLGKRLGWGGHRHYAEQLHPRPARRGPTGEWLQLGHQQLSQRSQSEWPVCEFVPKNHNQHHCQHGERSGEKARRCSRKSG